MTKCQQSDPNNLTHNWQLACVWCRMTRPFYWLCRVKVVSGGQMPPFMAPQKENVPIWNQNCIHYADLNKVQVFPLFEWNLHFSHFYIISLNKDSAQLVLQASETRTFERRLYPVRSIVLLYSERNLISICVCECRICKKRTRVFWFLFVVLTHNLWAHRLSLKF